MMAAIRSVAAPLAVPRCRLCRAAGVDGSVPVPAALGRRPVAEDAVADVRLPAAVRLVADVRELRRRAGARRLPARLREQPVGFRPARSGCRWWLACRRLTRSPAFRFGGRNGLFFGLLVMRMLPPIAVLVPMFVLFHAVGLINTRTSVVLAYTTFSLPLVVWIMRGFFEELPRELEESAWIDGASRLTGVPARGAAAGPAGPGGGGDSVPVTCLERFPVRRGAHQRRHAHAAGTDGRVIPATPASTGRT